MAEAEAEADPNLEEKQRKRNFLQLSDSVALEETMTV